MIDHEAIAIFSVFMGLVTANGGLFKINNALGMF